MKYIFLFLNRSLDYALASIDTICVLVPRGYEEDALQLAERFNEETIPAKTKTSR